MLHYPSDILVNVGCVDDKEEAVTLHLVDKQVIDNTACGVAHHTVEYLAIGCTGNIICKNIVHELLTLGAGHEYLTHMRYIEHTARLAHSVMLINDVAVLDWHIEATERAHQCAQCNVLFIKTSSFIFHRSVI